MRSSCRQTTSGRASASHASRCCSRPRMLLMLNVAILIAPILRGVRRTDRRRLPQARGSASPSGPYNVSMTTLFELVETSRRVAATPSRNAKVAELAALLRKLDGDEITTAVAFLSGETPQGRSGIGYALLRDARPAAGPVDAPQL